MKVYVLIFFFILLNQKSFCQTEDDLLKELEIGIENTENSGDQMELIDQLELYSQKKINLNACDYSDLIQVSGLKENEITAILKHREDFGHFISVLELQTIKELSLEKVKKLIKRFTVSDVELNVKNIRSLLSRSNKELVFNSKFFRPHSKGYLIDKFDSSKYFDGSPENLQVRFRGKYKNNLVYGISADKDAGEDFFSGSNPHGFDFHSAHFFIRRKAIIQKIALGDFKASFGQGLVIGTGMGSGKSALVLNVKKAELGLIPYRSLDENNFMRGGGINLAFRKFEYTLFLSRHRVDALLEPSKKDSSKTTIRSFPIDGYHRTESENDKENKAIQKQLGQAIGFRTKRLFMGSAFLYTHYNYPISFEEKAYNMHNFKGKSFYKTSLYFEYFILNARFFGEVARASNQSMASLAGMFMSLNSDLDMVFLYRNYSRNYIWNFGNAFSDQSNAANEKGLYVGLNFKPRRKLECSAFIDLFKVPYHSFQIDGPHPESDFLINLAYSFTRHSGIYFRFRRKLGYENIGENQLKIQNESEKLNFRTHLNTILNEKMNLDLRFECSKFVSLHSDNLASTLLFINLSYKTPKWPIGLNARVSWFSGDVYESRIFALENDVAYSWNIQSYYGSGVKYYILVKYNWRKRIKFQMKYSQMVYYDRTTIGSAYNERIGNRLHQINALLSYTIK